MPDKQRVIEIVSLMPETASYEEILQTLSICYSDQRANADTQAGRIFTTEAAKQRVRELAGY